MDRTTAQNEQDATVRPALAVNPSAWIGEHGDILYQYALVRVRRPEVDEELVQETFLAALKAADKYRGRSSERTWLTGILRHKLVHCFRSRSRGIPESDQVGHEDWLATFFDETGSWIKPPNPHAVNPETLVERDEFWPVFDSCLDNLPARTREAFVRRVVEGEDIETICDFLVIEFPYCAV
jgi:RNA polymerase sigma-70 factor (ECF subfamily)